MNNNLMKKQKCEEVVSKRSANVKVFENEDHSFTAAIYDKPVHYMKNGSWEEIDNRLVAGTEEEGDVENTAGNLKIRLSNKAKEKKMIRIGDGHKKLCWGLEGCAPVKRQFVSEAAADMVLADGMAGSGVSAQQEEDGEAGLRQALAAPHMFSKVIYPEVFAGVDMVCILDGDSFKENLIMKGPEAQKNFIWHYATGKLTAEQAEEKVLFKDDNGDMVYQLSAPYMEDAAGKRSSALSLALQEGKNKKEAIVTLAIDEAWLADESRTWPVTIDPAISTPVARTSIQDCHVSSYYSTDNFYNSSILKTGNPGGSVLRSYMRFTLPAINQTADMVVNARLYVTKHAGGSDRRFIDIHRVTKDWTSSTLTWNNKPAYDEKVLDFADFTSAKALQLSFDITGVVKDWYQNGKNYGLLMKDHAEAEGSYTEYVSSDDTSNDEKLRPRILITYVNYSGLEDYWTYHSHSVGRAGTGHVNDYNGNLIFVHDTMQMTGSRMPITLSHVFNSNDRATNMGYGKGIRLSCHQTIASKTIDADQYYQYTDGDGTVHYFKKNSEGAWKDESGLELTLVISTDAASMYTITDKEDTKLIFRNSGRLAKIVDANGNTLTITYSSAKLVKLEDGSGRTATFTYGSDGNMATTVFPSGQTKQFTYDSNGRLTTITDVDGQQCTFTYDANGMMTKASDPYGYSISYTYYGTAPYRVKKVAETAGSTAGQSVTFTYGNNQTKFTDEKGRSQYYLFNNSGNTVSVRDDEGYGAVWKYDSSKANRLSKLSNLQYTPVQLLKGSHVGLTGWETYVNKSAAVVSEDTSQAYIGEKSIRIRNTDTSAYGIVVQRVNLIAGKKYVFSTYAKTAPEALVSGSSLCLQIQTADMTEITKTTVPVKGALDWKRLQVAFTVPGTAGSSVTIRIVARAIYIKGDTWFDGFQLEEGEAASRLNLVVNNNFQYDLYGYTKSADMESGDGIVPVGRQSAAVTLKGTVIRSDINLRTGPGTEFDVLAVVPKGTSVPIYGADYDGSGVKWYIVTCTVGGTAYYGYLMGTYLSLNGPSTAVTVTAIAGGNDLNIRSGAGTGNTSLVQVARGQKMTVNGAAKDSSGVKWYKVALTKSGKEYEGYVSSEYVAVLYPTTESGKVANTTTVNVRYGPGMNYTVAQVLNKNHALTITGRAVLSTGVEWLYVNGTKDGTAFKGYINSIYVNVTGRGTLTSIQVKAPDTVPAGNGPLGDKAFMINGGEAKDKRLFYEVKVSGKKGDAYVASAWGCGHTVPLSGDRHFGIRVNFYKDNGKVDNIQKADFGADTSAWQYLSQAFVAGQDYDRIYVGYWYQYNANPAYFTGLSLFKEEFGVSYVYDKDGNVISVTDQAKNAGKFEYDSASNLKKLIDPKGNNFTYTYDSKHNVLTAKSAANLNYAFTYDAYGNPLTSKVVNPDTPSAANTAMTAKATYTTGTAAGQYMASQTSPEGSTVTYTWDANKGQMTKATDAAGNATSYTYDTLGRVTKVAGKAAVAGSAADVNVAYTYTSDRLTKIRHNGFDYGFTYDGFGNRTGVAIAGTTVISQTYAAKNGLLSKAVYGNGWEISYTYDSLDRTTAVTAKKDTTSYTLCRYIYDKQGRLARVTDGQDSTQSCTYGYDLTDRLCEAVFDNGSAFRYTYDANDCLTKEELITADGTRTVSRTYDADSRETKFTCGSASVAMAYDKIGRLSTVKRHGGKHTTTYTYKTGSDGGQTGQLAKVANGSDTYEYRYDVRGNVQSVAKNGAWRWYYEYDAQGQLVKEVDTEQNMTICYLYDAGGNMTQKRTYAVGLVDDLTDIPYVTKTYTYDSTWKDRLSAVNGQAYTYDAIGNLLSDGIRTYTWKNGRQLASITADSLTAAYTYDVSGMRTSKTVNGVKTEYLTASGRVLSEKKGSTWQHYLYDAGGQLYAIQYKGADYYYVRDGLMNITGLVDSNGNTVVSYEYDSWGVMLGISGSMAGTLGQDNPYRYKGYYYDTETMLYYLGSRYYNPGIGRFVNADEMISGRKNIQGYNLFVCCFNNPVNMSDENGYWPTWSDVKKIVKKAVRGVKKGIDYAVQGFVSTILGPSNVIIIKTHYTRNIGNVGVPQNDSNIIKSGYIQMQESDAKFHQNNTRINENGNNANRKYVSPDGHKEAVYYSDGNINTTPEDMGTYNFCPAMVSGDTSKIEKVLRLVGHGILDVFPYMLYGNSPADSTTIVDRVIMIFK